ncbi:NINE protein [Acidicapsa acidisoli]|uniref:NINE protein n=1 Tax=Acidicapsa acidisoli TaxID=1615681 RepID=UPI0021DFC430|nr:NINE protein [Acidicapsa acidisoli]
MAEFSVAEQMQLTEGMTEQQKFLFQAQYGAERKDRVRILVISVFLGAFGIDRFLVGDIGLGLLKLLTGGLLGILWLVDIFLIMGRVDDFNRTKAHEIAMTIRMSGPGVQAF